MRETRDSPNRCRNRPAGCRAFAAPSEFFEGSWEVDPRRFERRLHGKAYWMGDEDSSDLLVGSPNLSGSALLRTAGDGNLEVAILVAQGAKELSEPEGAPWAEEGLPELAASRLEAEVAPSEESSPKSFNAWVDGERITTTGLDDGQVIESWDRTGLVPIAWRDRPGPC
jgi:hypothetical protein